MRESFRCAVLNRVYLKGCCLKPYLKDDVLNHVFPAHKNRRLSPHGEERRHYKPPLHALGVCLYLVVDAGPQAGQLHGLLHVFDAIEAVDEL